MATKAQRVKRRDMASATDILNHWLNTDKFKKLGIFIPDNGDCFACGQYLRIERAHIKPLHENGTNNADNLHLLCSTCHIESEELRGRSYWSWIKHTNSKRYRSRTIRILDKQVNIIGFKKLVESDSSEYYKRKYAPEIEVLAIIKQWNKG